MNTILAETLLYCTGQKITVLLQSQNEVKIFLYKNIEEHHFIEIVQHCQARAILTPWFIIFLNH